MIFVTELRFHEGRRSPVIIWLCLWFSSICFNEISQNVHNLWNLSCRSFKSRKGLHGQFARYLQFCVFFLYLKFGLMNFFCLLTDTRKGTHMFSSPANLGNLPKETRYISLEDLYFLYPITLRNRIELRQDLCLSMRKLSNLSRHMLPFGNLWHGVFFSVSLFFRIPSHKNCIVLNCF